MEWRDIFHLHPDCEERFVATLDVPELKNAGVTLAGQSLLKTSYRIGRAVPDYHTVLFTLAGGGLLQTRDGHCQIERDSIMVLPARAPHLFVLEQHEQWQCCWFLLADDERWQFLHQQQSRVEPISGQGEQFNQTLSLLAAELKRPADIQQLDLLAKVLLNFLDRILDRNSELPRQQIRLQRLFDEVGRQLHFPWTVAELAQRMFLSEPQFYRLVRQHLGASPMQFITRMRIQRGQDLLIHSQLSVKQIAQSLGYEDGLSFSHCFKKHVGLSPQRWRNHQRNL
ncbi:AraC family transcriptional regulator [Neiella marina]|uniref:AraC family transcriptional regulator n=1 Tax=Neiella marina TaxID=508461 RepID=A0A8J2U6D6_9GAMM|nr:AraC family transcriptional regulator [Neiella marina]GGA81593.1 AraC family transcriptional regulator [Neiella marina]